MATRVLVAGATGYLGKYVVQAFKVRGYTVRALARNSQKLERVGPFLEPAVRDQVDEVFVGQVTQPKTLHGLCDDVEIVFSSVGITRQREGYTFRDVDYQGNVNILQEALRAGVHKFVFVSVFQAPRYEFLAGIKAREDFVRRLAASGLEYAVVRPTGYFSDMSEILRMAQRGRVYLVGNGESRMNPIHGADLAEVCADTAENDAREVPVGGPDVYTYNRVAGLAFAALGQSPRITHIPVALARLVVYALRPFSRQLSDLVAFFVTATHHDAVAPPYGQHHLADYYAELLARER